MSLVKYNNNSISSITSAGQLASGSLVSISEQTASGSASISFTTGIDSTYPIYKFEFINCHPATDGAHFLINFRDGGSLYDAVKTTTAFYSYHDEADTEASVIYSAGSDLTQSTSGQRIAGSVGSDADQQCSGTLRLFNPSSSTFVKHFISNSSVITSGNYNYNWHSAGYINTTTAIDGVQFSFSSGNIDSGTIKLYGIKDS